MRVELPSLSFQLRKDLAAAGIEMPLGHVQQCLATTYGYGSLAAYQAAKRTTTTPTSGPPHTLNLRKLEQRLSELGYLGAHAEAIAHVIMKRVETSFDAERPSRVGTLRPQRRAEMEQPATQTRTGERAMAKSRFFLPVEPDPCAGLVVEKGPRDEGVGRWVPEKHTLLAKLLGGTRAARAKWSERVLIDPFCGPGRIQVKGESTTRDGGAVVAWRQSVAHETPFTKVLVGDINPERAEACRRRLEALGAPVQAFVGPASETSKEMAKAISSRALALAYVDPYNLAYLSFDIINVLGSLKHIDFLVHFSTMDLQRNVDMELDDDRARFDEAAPGWRTALNVKGMSKTELRQAFFAYWMSLVARLGFKFSKEMPLMRGDRHEPLYRLVSFSRHAFPNGIWDDVAKSQNLELF
jgi:three-Cys-motif partner protein